MKNNYRFTLRACYLGYVTQAIVNNFLPLLFLIFRSEFGIPLEKITLLITVNFVIQLLVDILSARLIDKISHRGAIVTAHVFSSLGIAGIYLLPDLLPSPFAGLLISVIIYAVGGGLIEVLISPIAEACPTDNKASEMSLLHSFYCWGSVAVVLFSTVFLRISGKESWRLLACIWAILPLANAFLFSAVPISHLTEEGEEMPLRSLFSTGKFRLFVILMLAAGASELSMSQWASAFVESGLGVSKAVGDIAGPCLFAAVMGTARVLHAKYGERFSITSVLAVSGGLCVISYLITTLSPIPTVSLIGCALCGFSVGVLWPGVFSLASAEFPKGGAAMFAILAFAGDIGCSGGPTLVGMLSAALGDDLRYGLLSAAIFPILLITCAILCKKLPDKGEH